MAGLTDIQKLMKIVSPIKAVETAMAPKLIQTAGGLRGGLQQASQLLQQLKGKPGAKAAQIEQMFGHLAPGTKLSPAMLAAAAKKPKLLVQRSAAKQPYDEDLLPELTMDTMWGPELLDRRVELFKEQLEDLAGLGDYPQAQRLLNSQPPRGQDTETWEQNVVDYLRSMANDEYLNGIIQDPLDLLINNDVVDAAEQIAARSMKSTDNFAPSYEQYQRQPPTRHDSYFENVLRAPPQRAREINSMVADNGESWPREGYHFGNNGQLGHIRGSISANQQVMSLDEIQSDPLHALGEGALPELQGIYGKLGRSALDRAAAANIPFVNIPTGAAITSVRDPSKRSFYNKLYDTTLNKELYEPLQDQGVKVNRSTGWNNIELTPELMEEIKKGNLLNYKNGGVVQGGLTQCKRK